ncbi:hypothetical protein AWN90_03740 [Nocardia terpenica]|uniref:Uncharacterized protein n=2 Tax=Nocardia terpenica TaxID=455432 RepID=A0A164JHF1_9NOCA|nr:hypothetical protein AWN90_03740 [Nocardia terpenica]
MLTASAVPIALVLWCGGVAEAAIAQPISDQPGVTGPAQPGTTAPPVEVADLHLPEPVPPVAPVKPPDNTIRIGQFETPSPDWLPPQVRDCINNTAAGAEAQVAPPRPAPASVAPLTRSDRPAGSPIESSACATCA